MYKGKSILGFIPARGQSKGLPRKNLRVLAGRPLIAWTIAAAQRSAYLDRIIVSTEDVEIAAIARQEGANVPFLRPDALSGDESPVEDAILDALARLSESYDLVSLLQPTSPLRDTVDIDRSIEMCVDAARGSCVSVTEARPSPYWMARIVDGERLESLFTPAEIPRQRQKLPRIYSYNGAVYTVSVAELRRCRRVRTPDVIPYVMPRERSVDIDDELDMRIAEALLLSGRGAFAS